MQDNIPDALIAAFERQYDTSWNDPQLRNERMAMRYGWVAAIESRQCLVQISEPEAEVWPCVNIDVDESGNVTNAKLYSPGLPAGNHDVYPVRVPYIDEHSEAWLACAAELEKASPGFMSLGNMNGIECAVAAIRDLAARAALAATPAAAPAWDGKLPERLQRALNELRIDCKTDAVSSLEFEVRSAFEGMHTSLTTVKRMYHAAQKRLDSVDAAKPDPFVAAEPVVLPPPDLWRDAEGLRGYAADPGNGPWYTAETVRALLAQAATAEAAAATVVVVPPASQRDELLQVALDFIGTLTGMSPPPIEVAPPEVFAPFYAFVDRVQAITAPQQADTRDANGLQFLMESDQHLLHRFIETTEDDESYDIGKDAVKRLAEIGVLSNHGFGRYSVTMFGYWVHEHFWHQNPSLPLKTNADRDREHRAAIAAAKGE